MLLECKKNVYLNVKTLFKNAVCNNLFFNLKLYKYTEFNMTHQAPSLAVAWFFCEQTDGRTP